MLLLRNCVTLRTARLDCRGLNAAWPARAEGNVGVYPKMSITAALLLSPPEVFTVVRCILAVLQRIWTA